jgi:hypothetical protein
MDDLDFEDSRWRPRFRFETRSAVRIARQGEDVSPDVLTLRAETTSGLRLVAGGLLIVDESSSEPLEDDEVRNRLDDFRRWLDHVGDRLRERGLSEERIRETLAHLRGYADEVEQALYSGKESWLSWRVRQVSVEQAEAAHLVSDPQLGPEPVPFGFVHAAWRRLLDAMQPGDEVWEFCSPPEMWDDEGGRAGYVLVRAGRTIEVVLTSIN